MYLDSKPKVSFKNLPILVASFSVQANKETGKSFSTRSKYWSMEKYGVPRFTNSWTNLKEISELSKNVKYLLGAI